MTAGFADRQHLLLLLAMITVAGCGGTHKDQAQQPKRGAAGRIHETAKAPDPADRGSTLPQLLANATSSKHTITAGHLELGGGQTIPVRQIGTWVDPGARNEQEFAISVGRTLRALSANTGSEFCGRICRHGAVWGAAILTIDSGRYCPDLPHCPGTEWRPEGQGIHSHRKPGPYQMTVQDTLLRPGSNGEYVFLDAERASEEDLVAGGWVVGEYGLWHIKARTLVPVWDYQREQAGPPAQGTPKL